MVGRMELGREGVERGSGDGVGRSRVACVEGKG
jgi:hypothetical protein